jgi:leader peptidase (prepilin peptidase)/N-methyltransferase
MMGYTAVLIALLAAAPLALLAKHVAQRMIASERAEWAFQGISISQAHPGPRLLITAIFLGVAVAGAVWRLGLGVQLVLAIFFIVGLVVLGSVDLQILLLPDSGTLPLLWVGLVAAGAGMFVGPADAILGAATGYALVWAVHHAGRGINLTPGIGLGDAKMLAAIGAWTGYQAAIQILAMALAAMVFVGLIARRHRGGALPLGPGLAAAGIAMFVLAPK